MVRNEQERRQNRKQTLKVRHWQKKRAHGTSSSSSSQPSSALHPFNQKSQSHTKLETKKECLSLPSYPDKKKQKQQKFLQSMNRCKTAADQWLSKKILQKSSSSRKLIIQQRKAKWGREREKKKNLIQKRRLRDSGGEVVQKSKKRDLQEWRESSSSKQKSWCLLRSENFCFKELNILS